MPVGSLSMHVSLRLFKRQAMPCLCTLAFAKIDSVSTVPTKHDIRQNGVPLGAANKWCPEVPSYVYLLPTVLPTVHSSQIFSQNFEPKEGTIGSIKDY